MLKFMIVSGISSELREDMRVEHIFDAQTVEEAGKISGRWLTGDGLPCAGPGLNYFLLEFKQLDRTDHREIWQNHILNEALRSSSTRNLK